MAIRYYFGVIEPVKGKGFRAHFPDLPDFVITGASVEEVKLSAEQALTPFLSQLKRDARDIPLPRTELYTSPFQRADEVRILIPGDIPDEAPDLLIVRNAQRLLGEARLLFRSGSMATAVALSIIAIEEAGKYLIHVDSERSLAKKGRADHRDKQAVVAEVFDRMFLVEALIEVVRDYEQHLREVEDSDSLSDFLQMSEKERLELAYSILSEDKGMLQRLVSRVAGPDEHSIDFSLNVRRNKISAKREQSLYVDIRDGKLGPTPFEITFDEAGEWLERAEFAVMLAERSFREQQRKGCGGIL